MDNIQKSILFVLITAGSVLFIMDAMGDFAAQDPTSASQPATTIPDKKPPKLIEQVAEEDDNEEESTEFGEPLVDAEPIDDEGASNDEVDSDAPVPNGPSAVSLSPSIAPPAASNDRIAGSSGSSAGPPVFQGTTLPSPPPAVPVPGGVSTRKLN